MLKRRRTVSLWAVPLLLGFCGGLWLAATAGLAASSRAATPPAPKDAQPVGGDGPERRPPPPARLDPGDFVVTEATSAYTDIQIVLHPRALPTGGKEWSLRMVFDGLIQSEVLVDSGDRKEIRIKEPFTSGAKYTDLLFLPLLFAPKANRLLMIGGGGGVVPTLLRRDFPEMAIDVVEIDPVVVRLAERYFGYRANEGGTKTHVMDGRAYVRECKERYDIIVLDAYSGGNAPPHLVTREFFELLKSRLTEQGVVQLNLLGALDGPEGMLYRRVLNTVLVAFGPDRVYVFPRWYDPQWGHTPEIRRRRGDTNIEILATNFDTEPNPLPRDEIVRRAQRLIEGGRIRLPSLPIHAGNCLAEERNRDLTADRILTDPRPKPATKGGSR